jgi:hypothetical protein
VEPEDRQRVVGLRSTTTARWRGARWARAATTVGRKVGSWGATSGSLSVSVGSSRRHERLRIHSAAVFTSVVRA